MQKFMLKNVLPMFSFKSFTVCNLRSFTFRSFIHFEFIFLCVVLENVLVSFFYM